MLQNLRVDHGIEKTPDSRVFHMCPDCGKQFPTKSAMQDHQIKHSDEKNFVCMECGKQFKRKESLHFHMKKHAGIEDYHCDQCAARYVSSSALVAHKLSKHTDQADKETFLCNFCGQSFNKKEYFSKHVTKHTDPSDSMVSIKTTCEFTEVQRITSLPIVRKCSCRDNIW